MNVKKVAENLVTKMLLPEVNRKKSLGRNYAFIDVPLFAQTEECYNQFAKIIASKGMIPRKNQCLTLFGCNGTMFIKK